VVAERIFLEAEMLENGVGGEPKNATAALGTHTRLRSDRKGSLCRAQSEGTEGGGSWRRR
jgi:hypothetical protein